MNGYLFAVFGVILISSFLTAIFPEGKTTAIVKSVSKTVCLVVIISPILAFLQNTGKFTENTFEKVEESVIYTDDAFIKYYSELRIKESESLLETEIFEKFKQETEIKMDWNYENYTQVPQIKIKKITIHLTSNATDQEKENIKLYVTKYYCSEVLIE